MNKEFLELQKVQSSLLELKGVDNASYGEVVAVTVDGKKPMVGRVIKIDNDDVVVQVFGETIGMSVQNTKVRFKGICLKFPSRRGSSGVPLTASGSRSTKEAPYSRMNSTM